MIREFTREDAATLAEIHYRCLPESFIASMGEEFLTRLYLAMLTSKNGFTMVYESEGSVQGFFTCCIDTSAFFKELLVKKWYTFVAPSIKHLIRRPGSLRNILESFLYPRKESSNGAEDSAELLTIAIQENFRGMGIGTHLLDRLIEELKARSIKSLKVGVHATMTRANNFYMQMGFKLKNSIEMYGNEIRFYEYTVGL